VQALLQSASTNRFVVHAYCVMPDHVHLLAQGTHPQSDLLEFVLIFKMKTSFRFNKLMSRTLWEFSYYDHILRQLNDIEAVAGYVWWNPVRKNLCQAPTQYPFSGSQTMDWMQAARPTPTWSPPA
jgi:REP element-mobilizing transposase RayT